MVMDSDSEVSVVGINADKQPAALKISDSDSEVSEVDFDADKQPVAMKGSPLKILNGKKYRSVSQLPSPQFVF